MGTLRCGRMPPEVRAMLADLMSTAASVVGKAEAQQRAVSVLLHARLRRIVCSTAWEDELYAMIMTGKLAQRPTRDGLARSLLAAGIYPPGGADSLMLRCDCCGVPSPPQTVRTPLLCRKCLQARQVKDVPGDARTLKALEGRCHSCGIRKPYVPVYRVRVCDVCDSNAMSDRQVGVCPSGHQFRHKIKMSEVPAHLGATGYRVRSARRILQVQDFPQVVSGRTDGSL